MRGVHVPQVAAVAHKRRLGRHARDAGDQLKLVGRFGNGAVALQNGVDVKRQLLSEFFGPHHIDDVACVDIAAEVALDGSLGERFGRCQYAGDLLAPGGDGMHVGRRAADVKDDDVADVLVQQHGAFHDGARRGNDAAADHVAHMLHPGGRSDVLFKHPVDNAARRLDVELVELGVHIFRHIDFLAGFAENQFHLALVLDIAGVNDRGLQPGGRYQLGVIDGGIALAVIGAARDEDEVGLLLTDFFQIAAAQPAGRRHFNNAAGAQRRFARRLDRHVVNQAVYRHAQAAGRRRGGKHLAVFHPIRAERCRQTVGRLPQSDAHVALQHAGGRLPLPQKQGLFQIKRIDYRRG